MKKTGMILPTLLLSAFLAFPAGAYAMTSDDSEGYVTENEQVLEEVPANNTSSAKDEVFAAETETAVDTETVVDTENARETEHTDQIETVTETETVIDTETVVDTDTEDTDTEKETETNDDDKKVIENDESESETSEGKETETEDKETEIEKEDSEENALFEATYAQLNHTALNLKQETNYTCTLCSATMMLRRAALLDGKDWNSITESAVRNSAWSGGLLWSFNYGGYDVYGATYIGNHSTSEKWNTLRDLLTKHPEGVVAYNGNDEHAVLLTDYVNGTFYCVDPANETSVGRIALRDAYKITGPSSITRVWYILQNVKAPTGSNSGLTQPTPVIVNPVEPEKPETPDVEDPKDSETPVNEVKVTEFVTRLYKTVLGRNPEAKGLKDWVNKMTSRTLNGSEVADAFVNSNEYKNKKTSDDSYVDMLYVAFMGRNADSNGKTYWTNLLDIGMSRYYAFAGFANSNEFKRICTDYGIDQGEVLPTEARDLNVGVTGFVSRLYTKALARSYEVQGLNDWCAKIYFASSKRTTAVNVALQFFSSNEFQRKSSTMDDSEYLKILYRTFLNREADRVGLNYWLKQIENGKSRENIIKGFASSNEFGKIMDKYDIK